jgi:peptidoglycan/LPS O-acetylase OafA/YrhL
MSRLLGFDGVRAIACLLVICHHAFQRLKIDAAPSLIAFFEPVFLTTASAGVSVFFVLSGALLSMPFWNAYFDKRLCQVLKSM